MQEGDEREGGGIALGRTLALSDGIVAIAMTLLAFQIQPPDLHGTQVHHLASALGALGNRYFVYVLSFGDRDAVARAPPDLPPRQASR